MLKKFYKWVKVPPTTSTMIEVTKDYFADGDEYINEANGWKKLENQHIEVEVEDGTEDS